VFSNLGAKQKKKQHFKKQMLSLFVWETQQWKVQGSCGDEFSLLSQ
jgi:hypothetical protein